MTKTESTPGELADKLESFYRSQPVATYLAAAKELRRLEKLCRDLAGEEVLHQTGGYETEMRRLVDAINTLKNVSLERLGTIEQLQARIAELEKENNEQAEQIVEQFHGCEDQLKEQYDRMNRSRGPKQ